MSDRMREVELVEGSSPPPAAVSSDDVGRTAPSWLRRNARWLVPTAVVAILAVVGTQLVVDARERSRLEALAAIPGIVPPTGPGIGVIWRADPTLATVLQGGTPIDGLLVGGKTSTTGTVDLVGLDMDTGAAHWTTRVQLPPAELAPGSSRPSASVGCVPVHHGGRALAACLSQQYGEGVVGLPDAAAWVVDPKDGSVVAHDVVPGDAGVAFTDDALVVADRVAADSDAPATADASSVRWRATATDVVSGAARWTFTTPATAVLPPADDPAGGSGGAAATLQTFGDRLVLGVDAHAWILGDDGTLVRDVALQPGAWVEEARSGAFVATSYTTAGVYFGTLLLPDGGSVPIDETAASPTVDDGSAHGVVLTLGSGSTTALGLSGWDATTGKRLWHRQEPVATGLLLHGVLYIATGKKLEAVDATTGRTRWSTTLDYLPQQISTDGHYLLVPGLNTSLRAYLVSSGRLAWTKDLRSEVAGDRSPVYIQGFQAGVHDPRLYVWMDDGAVAVLG